MRYGVCGAPIGVLWHGAAVPTRRRCGVIVHCIDRRHTTGHIMWIRVCTQQLPTCQLWHIGSPCMRFSLSRLNECAPFEAVLCKPVYSLTDTPARRVYRSRLSECDPFLAVHRMTARALVVPPVSVE